MTLDFFYSSVINRWRYTETSRYKEDELWEDHCLSQTLNGENRDEGKSF